MHSKKYERHSDRTTLLHHQERYGRGGGGGRSLPLGGDNDDPPLVMESRAEPAEVPAVDEGTPTWSLRSSLSRTTTTRGNAAAAAAAGPSPSSSLSSAWHLPTPHPTGRPTHSPTATAAPTADRGADFSALSALYVATGGGAGNWTSARGWLTGQPCTNSWYGVECNIRWEATDIIIQESNGLRGTLPNQLGGLLNLTGDLVLTSQPRRHDPHAAREAVGTGTILLPLLQQPHRRHPHPDREAVGTGS